MRYRGAWSHGNASVTWREIHAAVDVCRHDKRHPKSSSVAHNDKTIQNLECDRRQDKEVDRRHAVDMIAEKRPPALNHIQWLRLRPASITCG